MYSFVISNIIKPDYILKPINDQQLEPYPSFGRLTLGLK